MATNAKSDWKDKQMASNRKVDTAHGVLQFFPKLNPAWQYARESADRLVFSEEVNVFGVRRFVAANPNAFYAYYEELKPSARLYHEVLPWDQPVKFYLGK